MNPLVQQIIGEAGELESHSEVYRRVRDQEGLTKRYTALFGAANLGQGVGFGIGSRHFTLEDGIWYEVVKKRNKAYFEQPGYCIVYPGPDPHAFIAIKYPKSIKWATTRKAIFAIFRAAVGRSFQAVHAGLEGPDVEIYDRRVSGTKPEPAYEIFSDGSFKQTSP